MALGPKKKHIIVFSHGFAVDMTDGGLFTDIKNSIKKHEGGDDIDLRLFDYNEINENRTIMWVSSLEDHVNKLEEQIENIRKEDSEAKISLIGHSEGALVAALLKNLERINKMIFIAPPFDPKMEKLNEFLIKQETFKKSSDDGFLEFKNRYGSTIKFLEKFWTERDGLDLPSLYNHLAENTKLSIIEAKNDKIVENPEWVEGVLDKKIKIYKLDGGHQFRGEAREPLIHLVQKELFEGFKENQENKGFKIK